MGQALELKEPGSGDGGDVGAYELGCLLIDAPLSTLAVAVLEVGESSRCCYRIHLVVAVVMKGNVNKRIIGQTENEIAHVVGTVLLQLSEHALDTALILICSLARSHRVPGNKPLLHQTTSSTGARPERSDASAT